MQSLTSKIRPLLNGEVALSDLSPHDRQALDIYIHFKGVQIAELKGTEKIKAALAKIPEPVRELTRQSARRGYKRGV